MLREAHALQLQRGARRFVRGRGLVDRLLGDVAGAGELLGALVVGLGEIEARLGVGDLGLRQVVVELDQHVARVDGSALGEADRLNPAGDLGGDLHQLVGAQTADGTDVGGGGGTARDRRLHRNRGARAFALSAFLEDGFARLYLLVGRNLRVLARRRPRGGQPDHDHEADQDRNRCCNRVAPHWPTSIVQFAETLNDCLGLAPSTSLQR